LCKFKNRCDRTVEENIENWKVIKIGNKQWVIENKYTKQRLSGSWKSKAKAKLNLNSALTEYLKKYD